MRQVEVEPGERAVRDHREHDLVLVACPERLLDRVHRIVADRDVAAPYGRCASFGDCSRHDGQRSNIT